MVGVTLAFRWPKQSVTTSIWLGQVVTAAPIRYRWARFDWIQWRKGVKERFCADERVKRADSSRTHASRNPKDLQKLKPGEVVEKSVYVANHTKVL